MCRPWYGDMGCRKAHACTARDVSAPPCSIIPLFAYAGSCAIIHTAAPGWGRAALLCGQDKSRRKMPTAPEKANAKAYSAPGNQQRPPQQSYSRSCEPASPSTIPTTPATQAQRQRLRPETATGCLSALPQQRDGCRSRGCARSPTPA